MQHGQRAVRTHWLQREQRALVGAAAQRGGADEISGAIECQRPVRKLPVGDAERMQNRFGPAAAATILQHEHGAGLRGAAEQRRAVHIALAVHRQVGQRRLTVIRIALEAVQHRLRPFGLAERGGRQPEHRAAVAVRIAADGSRAVKTSIRPGRQPGLRIGAGGEIAGCRKVEQNGYLRRGAGAGASDCRQRHGSKPHGSRDSHEGPPCRAVRTRMAECNEQVNICRSAYGFSRRWC